MDTPKIPTLKDSQKPQVKVRGAAAGATLFDRLKQFKKKDLAFILAGLGTLFMAPLAEHFMMSPETGDGTLQQGWKGGSGSKGMFDGSGSSPYEPGTSGLAPGSAIGGGSDVITPLNVRDPSALVMGPGSTQQPPTNSVMPGNAPATAPVKTSDSDMRDALAASARGVGAAAKRTLLPVPKIPLSGSGGLRGLGAVGGGSSASAGGGPISSNGLVSGKASSGGGLGGVRAADGYKGVARGQTSSNGGGIDALKKAADAAGGVFNRGGALNALNSAASQTIPTNTGGGLGGDGAGGKGSNDKPFGGDQSKDSKSVGESLAFLKAKAMQEAQIALWAKEQEAGDNKLEALKIRNSMAEAIANQIATAVGGAITCPITNAGGAAACFGGAGPAPTCTSSRGAFSGGTPLSDYTKCTFSGSKPGAGITSQYYWCDGGKTSICVCSQPISNTPVATGCSSGGGAASTAPATPPSGPGGAATNGANGTNGPNGANGPNGSGGPSGGGTPSGAAAPKATPNANALNSNCQSIDAALAPKNITAQETTQYNGLSGFGAKVDCNSDAVTGTGTGACSSKCKGNPSNSALVHLVNSNNALTPDKNGALDQAADALTKDSDDTNYSNKYSTSKTEYGSAQARIGTVTPSGAPPALQNVPVAATLGTSAATSDKNYTTLNDAIGKLQPYFAKTDEVVNKTVPNIIKMNKTLPDAVKTFNSNNPSSQLKVPPPPDKVDTSGSGTSSDLQSKVTQSVSDAQSKITTATSELQGTFQPQQLTQFQADVDSAWAAVKQARNTTGQYISALKTEEKPIFEGAINGVQP